MFKSVGLSGDIVSVKDNCVVKICETDPIRFACNINKQLAFDNPFIGAVPIIDQGYVDGKPYIKMPWLKCLGSLDWITRATVQQLQSLTRVLLDYFRWSISKATLMDFDYQAWQQKLADLSCKIGDSELQTCIKWLSDMRFKVPFYTGMCHGDLTLGNLFIVGQDTVHLEAIDFLSSFIEGPIIDLVKIRQDTKHLWLLQLMSYRADYNKVAIVLRHIDTAINMLIQSDQSLLEFYVPFQIVNLLRIIPYNKDARLDIYLRQEIKQLYEDYRYCTVCW